MKHTLFLIATAVACTVAPLKSQTPAASDSLPSMRREFYLSFANFSPVNIALRYKKQINPKTYFKIGLISLSAQATSNKRNDGVSFPVNSQNYSGGVEVGIERRRAITKKLSLFHGPALSVLYQHSFSKNLDPSIPSYQQKVSTDNVRGSIPYTIGLLFQVYNNFYAAVEINPAIYGSYQTVSNNVNGGTAFTGGVGFDNRAGLFSLVYRY